ncbi:sigma-70 RNA polymerase sigma factor region 4 domain-containing protein [Streptomyces vinaceus]|uniref:hypothetical protein n=1 Tax=Streptomyces vinaceus TaxID=1960 RepID=UPI0036A6C105
MNADSATVPRPQGSAERLVADAARVAQVRKEGFRSDGPRYRELHDELWVYGWRVMRAWMRDGTVIARCRLKGFRFPAPYTEVEEMMQRVDVRDEIAHTCVSKAVESFLSDLEKEDFWDAHQGATLRTYFIGRCLMLFGDAYRKWASPYRRRLEAAADGIWRGIAPVPDRQVPGLSFDEMITLQESLTQILRGASKEDRAICRLILTHDATQEQIAKQLGTTRKAVERRMAKLRARAHDLAAVGVITMPSVSSRTGR